MFLRLCHTIFKNHLSKGPRPIPHVYLKPIYFINHCHPQYIQQQQNFKGEEKKKAEKSTTFLGSKREERTQSRPLPQDWGDRWMQGVGLLEQRFTVMRGETAKGTGAAVGKPERYWQIAGDSVWATVRGKNSRV